MSSFVAELLTKAACAKQNQTNKATQMMALIQLLMATMQRAVVAKEVCVE
jgi:hypothetical protein